MLLLDTNASLWLSAAIRGSARARGAIETAVDADEAYFPSLAVWETAMLVARGRYALGQPVESWRADLLEAGLREAPLDGLSTAMAVAFEGLPPDPADRMIAATAARLGASLVTSDRRLLEWGKARVGPKPIDARR